MRPKVQGKMTALLTGRRGVFYQAGIGSDGTRKCSPKLNDEPWKSSCYELWRGTENETLGFRCASHCEGSS